MNHVSDSGDDPRRAHDPGDPGDPGVAGRMSRLFDRGRPQDFVAIGSVLGEGRYTRERLVELLCARDPRCDAFFFAGVLAELPLLPDEQFTALGLGDLEIAILRARFADWYRSILDSGPPG
ncbi:MAG: hypothetical protein QOE54_894 [Streptosporangiaceae bacterium]|jgi:hypothetical protein|nr:hypothetical protein [Streptosporangiaceae bacterium]MDX6428528.1 hypothetical protein [Streptosporangiaceae bacterium]